MIYSSSGLPAPSLNPGDSADSLKRQGIFALVGTAAMLAMSRVRPELIPENGVPGAGGVDPVF